MLKKSVFVLFMVVALLAVAFFSAADVGVRAASVVSVSFVTSGLNNYDNLVLTIDGVGYSYWDLGWRVFQWAPGSSHSVVASSPLTGWDTKVHQFSSWSNGYGLVGASGTFTVPSSDTVVTANYVSSSVRVTFVTSGLSNYDGPVLTVDGTEYTFWNLPSFQWVTGSSHSVSALSPLTGWNNNVYSFSSWSNGYGLVGASGTFTVPSSDTTVTTNYVKSTVDVTFTTSGLSNFDNNVLTIDGVTYTYWTIPWQTFTWPIGSSHTVVALTPLTGWDNVVHQFSSWTNGPGLSGATGTFIVPASDTTVTANYEVASSSATSLTINCNPATVDKTGTETTLISGALTVSGSGVSGKTVSLSYFDGASWFSIESVTTVSNGIYTYSWDVPVTIVNGQYALKADFSGDSSYEASSVTTGSLGNGGHLLVLPEYLWGGLVATLVSFAAFACFKRYSN